MVLRSERKPCLDKPLQRRYRPRFFTGFTDVPRSSSRVFSGSSCGFFSGFFSGVLSGCLSGLFSGVLAGVSPVCYGLCYGVTRGGGSGGGGCGEYQDRSRGRTHRQRTGLIQHQQFIGQVDYLHGPREHGGLVSVTQRQTWRDVTGRDVIGSRDAPGSRRTASHVRALQSGHEERGKEKERERKRERREMDREQRGTLG